MKRDVKQRGEAMRCDAVERIPPEARSNALIGCNLPILVHDYYVQNPLVHASNPDANGGCLQLPWT